MSEKSHNFSKFLENFHEVFVEFVTKLFKIFNHFLKICPYFSLYSTNMFLNIFQNFHQICITNISKFADIK